MRIFNLAFVFLNLVLCSSAYCEEGRYVFEKEFNMSSMSEPLLVPGNRVWEVRLKKLEANGIHTSDVYIDGIIDAGMNHDVSIHGKVDVSFNDDGKFPIYILQDSTMTVGDSRSNIVIRQYIVDEQVEKANVALMKLAESGDSKAQSEIAFLLSKGINGFAYDIDKSIYWYCRSAIQGYDEAVVNVENRLGDWREKCVSLTQDKTK